MKGLEKLKMKISLEMKKMNQIMFIFSNCEACENERNEK
jgi:hypothetical protein